MTEAPDKIELESIEDLSDRRVLEQINYIVAGGDVYQLKQESFGGDHYLKLVEEIPSDYWERYDND